MDRVFLFPRIVALFLTVSLALPNPALALRPAGLEESTPAVREEFLRDLGIGAGVEGQLHGQFIDPEEAIPIVAQRLREGFAVLLAESHLDGLLELRAVLTCAPIRAEVLSGARTERQRGELRELFRAIPLLELPSDIWEKAEEARFSLARKGHQAQLIDLVIACTAAHHGASLWTLDEDFDPIRQAVPFPRYLPES